MENGLEGMKRASLKKPGPSSRAVYRKTYLPISIVLYALDLDLLASNILWVNLSRGPLGYHGLHGPKVDRGLSWPVNTEGAAVFDVKALKTEMGLLPKRARCVAEADTCLHLK